METNLAVKLSANENCYGCSPKALEAIRAKVGGVSFYPEVNPVALKEKLAEKYGVTTGNIIVGAGSVRIIDGLIQTFVKEGEEVLTFEKSFVAYGQLSGFHQRTCRFAPLKNFRCVPENLLPFISDKTRLIFIANPNNPTGTMISHAELENLLKTIPRNVIVTIDEAYSEYVTDATFPDSILLQKKYPNLVILHSFSKIYGLAGLRIGYAIMDDKLAARMAEGQIPFSLNYLSSAAALAALEDESFIIQSARVNADERNVLYRELNSHGIHVLPSQSNFMYMWFEEEGEKKKVYDLLFKNGILVCDMKIFGQENALRITVGDHETNNKMVRILTE
ncbi:MAG: histidinol-phosphate transaminase [Bacteroidetes bacterium]|nr:histidinol-phosphate transaminase [Bacteroidota bacterium]